MLGVGLSHAKRHEVKEHRRAMTGLFRLHPEHLIGQTPFALFRQGCVPVGQLRRSVSLTPPHSLAP
jgi:hypothetical protein